MILALVFGVVLIAFAVAFAELLLNLTEAILEGLFQFVEWLFDW